MSGSFSIDMKDFEKGIKKLFEDHIPPEAEAGIIKAANELLHDAIYERPYAPFDEGHLRGSARVGKPESSKNEISIKAGFNIEYAARWHELSPAEDARINWTLPGSGRKYLESKMSRNAKKYLFIIAEHVKNAFKRGK